MKTVMHIRRGLIIILMMFVVCSMTSIATAASIPEKLQATFIYKIFGFQKNIADRAGSEVKIGVLFVASDPDSVEQKDSIKASLIALKATKKIADLPVDITEIEYTDRAQLAGALDDISILYVTNVDETLVADIKAACDEKKTCAFAVSKKLIKKGIATGIGLSTGRPKIMINKASAGSCDAEFGAALLKMADII